MKTPTDLSINISTPQSLKFQSFVGLLLLIALVNVLLLIHSHVRLPSAPRDLKEGNVVSDDGALCDGYHGILHISDVSETAKTGSFFFRDVLDGLIFAERYNLYPFIWIDKIDPEHDVYDPNVHTRADCHHEDYTDVLTGEIESSQQHISTRLCKNEPYRPSFETLSINEYYDLCGLENGNGVWQTYFQPTPIPFQDPSCKEKPVFQMTPEQIKAMHYCVDWLPKGWVVTSKMPNEIQPEAKNQTLMEWLDEHRNRAAPLVAKYYRPQKWLAEKIEQNNPAANGKSCLSVHISKKDIDEFFPYIDAYIETMSRLNSNQDVTIFVATHDAGVLEDLLEASSMLKRSMIKTQQPKVLQRTKGKDIFNTHETHRLNSEVLAHIFLLAKCDFLVHGKYVVAEGAIYINPSLRNRSVNVDFSHDERISPLEFAELVRSYHQNANS